VADPGCECNWWLCTIHGGLSKHPYWQVLRQWAEWAKQLNALHLKSLTVSLTAGGSVIVLSVLCICLQVKDKLLFALPCVEWTQAADLQHNVHYCQGYLRCSCRVCGLRGTAANTAAELPGNCGTAALHVFTPVFPTPGA
jgi:hypothetical protein